MRSNSDELIANPQKKKMLPPPHTVELSNGRVPLLQKTDNQDHN